MPDETMIPDYSSVLHVDHELLVQAFSEITNKTPAILDKPQLQGKTVAIARDNTCCFIYPDNLDWLISHGAKLVFFSLVASEPVPDGVDAIWLLGGYPELHAQQLSQSISWDSSRKYVDAGIPILAECGGAMLLGKALVDLNGSDWSMAGVFPCVSIMQTRLVALGHREEASGVKVHEFHYSTREKIEGLLPAFDVSQGDKVVRYKNVRASYIHWFFAEVSNQACAWFKTVS